MENLLAALGWFWFAVAWLIGALLFARLILGPNPKKAPKPDRILVDREGIAYPPTRPVKLRAKPQGKTKK